MRRPTAVLGAVLTAAVTTGGLLIVTSSSVGAATSVHNPIGHLDTARLSGSTVTVTGWAADRDLGGSVRLVVTIDKVAVRSVLAKWLRNDVARVFPSVGKYRGYTGTVPVPTGKHLICVTALNLGAGANSALGCVAVRVTGIGAAGVGVKTRAPYGHFDKVSYAGGVLSAVGWSIDPDTTGATFVDVSVNGASIGSITASVWRPDVGLAHKGSGANHGFNARLPISMASGNYRICASAINTAVGTNSSLGCRIYTVLPTGVPSTLHVGTSDAAARDMQARAIATHAAKAADFPASASSAARIAIAARAFLQQATGRRTAPPAQPKLPKFSVATSARAPDVQSVMGAKPALGNYPQVKTAGRSGVMHSLEVYRNDPRPTSPSAGDGIVGAAAILRGNGRTVHPSLPIYPANYTKVRAEVAVDNALARLGDSYVWAAGGPTTFDCSGLTQWAWAKAGVSLTHYTGSQAVQGVRIQANQLLPGDLVLFGSNVHHVGMYLGGGYMIDAPYTGAYVRVDTVSSFGDYSLAIRP